MYFLCEDYKKPTRHLNISNLPWKNDHIKGLSAAHFPAFCYLLVTQEGKTYFSKSFDIIPFRLFVVVVKISPCLEIFAQKQWNLSIYSYVYFSLPHLAEKSLIMPLIFKEIFVSRYACCTGENRSDHSETFAVNGQGTFPYLHQCKILNK